MKQEKGNGISGRAPHLAGDGHQRRTVRIGVREAHHKKNTKQQCLVLFLFDISGGRLVVNDF